MMDTAVPRFSPGKGVDGIPEIDTLLAGHLEAVRRRFGPAGLGVIDLPSLGTGQLDREQIRVCAALYWASEVEAAGLLPFVEALAEGVVHGTVVEPLGAVVPELMRFWRSREYRFHAAERRALFARIFGDASRREPDAFDQQFQVVIDALVAIGRAPVNQNTAHLEARAAVAVQLLGSRLTQLGAGIAGFVAREIVAQIRTALQLLQHADVVRVLGGGSPWQLVMRHARRLLGYEVEPELHLTRAVSGMRVIAWMGEQSAAIENGVLHVSRSAPVIAEAETWSAARGAG